MICCTVCSIVILVTSCRASWSSSPAQHSLCTVNICLYIHIRMSPFNCGSHPQHTVWNGNINTSLLSKGSDLFTIFYCSYFGVVTDVDPLCLQYVSPASSQCTTGLMTPKTARLWRDSCSAMYRSFSSGLPIWSFKERTAKQHGNASPVLKLLWEYQNSIWAAAVSKNECLLFKRPHSHEPCCPLALADAVNVCSE